MNRTVLSPLAFILPLFILLIRVVQAPFDSLVYALGGLVIGVELIAELGQGFLQVGWSGPAEILLKISTVLHRPCLLLPGMYPLDVYIASSNQLSKALCDRQKYIEALRLNSEIVAMIRKRCGNKGSALGGELVNRAYINGAMGNGEEAELAAQQALDILEDCGDRATVSLALNNLATVYVNIGRLDDALATYNKSLKLKEQLVNINSAALSVAYGNVGYTLLRSGKFAEAESYLRKAINLAGQAGQEEKATYRNNLGEALRAQGKLEESESMLREALKIRERSLSRTHPHLGYSYHNLGKLMADKGDFASSEEFFNKALKIRMRVPGIKQMDLRETAENYSKLLGKIGRHSEAEGLIEAYKLDQSEDAA